MPHTVSPRVTTFQKTQEHVLRKHADRHTDDESSSANHGVALSAKYMHYETMSHHNAMECNGLVDILQLQYINIYSSKITEAGPAHGACPVPIPSLASTGATSTWVVIREAVIHPRLVLKYLMLILRKNIYRITKKIFLLYGENFLISII